MNWCPDSSNTDLIAYSVIMEGFFFFKIKPNLFYIGYKQTEGCPPEKIFSGNDASSIDDAKEKVEEAFEHYLEELNL